METYSWRAFAGKAAVSAIFLLSIAIASKPCLAQYTAGHAVQECRLQQDLNYDNVPMLQGATMGTIGPQGADATYIVGVNGGGTVRVNMLANLEALVNMLANGAEIITVLWGSLLMLGVLHCMFRGRNGLKRCLLSLGLGASFLCTGLGIITNLLNSFSFILAPPWKHGDKIHLKFWLALFTIKAGLLIPALVNWLVAAARDANLLS